MAICMRTSMATINHNKTPFWNKELTKPVICNVAVLPTFAQCEVLNAVRRTLTECVKCLNEQQLLASEYFVLRRLVYMKHGQLRREKSYQGLKQIRTCVKKFFGLGLEKTVKEINAHFQDALVQEGIRVYLPSLQMFEHLLTQLLSAAALLTSTASRCAAVFLHVYRHLAAGMLIPANMVFMSMLSRIWACCQGLCLELQSWYQRLRPATDVLKPTEVAWLPEGEILPEDLSAWLTEQGFSSGLNSHTQEENDDTVASLMAVYHQAEEEEEEERAESPSDDVLRMPGEEDLGDPVNVGKRKRGIMQEVFPPRQDLEQSLPVKGVKVGRKEKIKKASTIQELQAVLRKFQKKRPDIGASKKTQRCSELLDALQSKSQALAKKGKEAQAPALVTKARKKLMKFFRLLTLESKRAPSAAPVAEQHAAKKKGKKQKKRSKSVAENAPTVASAQSEQEEVQVRRAKKTNRAVSEIESQKKKQKNNRAVSKKGGKKKRQVEVASAGRKDEMGCRKNKKNDLRNNEMKAAQLKQKKKKARK